MASEGEKLITSSSRKTTDDEAPSEEELSRRLVGYVCAFLCILFGVVSAACVQALGHSVPDFQLNLWRFGWQCVWATPYGCVKKLDLRISREFIVPMCVLCLVYSVLVWTILTCEVVRAEICR